MLDTRITIFLTRNKICHTSRNKEGISHNLAENESHLKLTEFKTTYTFKCTKDLKSAFTATVIKLKFSP